MTAPMQKAILEKLSVLGERSPDVRFGQLVAQLGFLADDQTGQTLWDVEDEELLRVMEGHQADLARRQQPNVA